MCSRIILLRSTFFKNGTKYLSFVFYSLTYCSDMMSLHHMKYCRWYKTIGSLQTILTINPTTTFLVVTSSWHWHLGKIALLIVLLLLIVLSSKLIMHGLLRKEINFLKYLMDQSVHVLTYVPKNQWLDS